MKECSVSVRVMLYRYLASEMNDCICVSLVSLFLQPISSTWYDYWGADYGTYGYNPYIGGVGIAVSKPPAVIEKPGSQSLSISVSQGEGAFCILISSPKLSLV